MIINGKKKQGNKFDYKPDINQHQLKSSNNKWCGQIVLNFGWFTKKL